MKIGLLWDSVSNNLGDRAIGIVLRRLLHERGLNTSVIDPISTPKLEEAATLIVGGGELIRAPGHPFYDVFRARGPWILNTVGVLDGTMSDYLDDYRYVSVRSNADRDRLGRGEIAPCLTVLFNHVLDVPGEMPAIPPDAIGVHANLAMHETALDLVLWLREQEFGPVVFFPLTHYNADAMLMQRMAEHVPGSIVLPALSPDQAFRAIGSLRGFISCSLHGMLFAYAQQTPFMALSSFPKIAHFLEDRGLEDFGFESGVELLSHFADILQNPPDHSQLIAADEKSCWSVLDRIELACQEALDEAVPSSSARLHVADPAAHRLEVESYHRQGELAARYLGLLMEKTERSSRSSWTSHAGSGQPDDTADADSMTVGATGVSSYGGLIAELEALRQERLLLRQHIADLRSKLWRARDQLAGMRRSWAGKLLLAYWRAINQLAPYGSGRRAMAKKVREWVRQRGIERSVLTSGERATSTAGTDTVGLASPTQWQLEPPLSLRVADPDYAELARRVEPSERELRAQAHEAANWDRPPVIELLTEVRDIPAAELRRMITSVRGQTNPHWRWRFMLHPALPERHEAILREFARADSRVVIRRAPSEHWTASNLKAAIESASGPYVALLDSGEIFAPQALFRFAQTLLKYSGTDLIYCDHDHVDSRGLRADPFFKPDWSPETMISHNLIANAFVFDRALADRAGFPDPEMEDAYLWDFALRLTSEAHEIRHLPEILAHVTDPSERDHPVIIDLIHQAQSRSFALREHLRRRGVRFPNIDVDLSGRVRAKWALSREWKVSIVIPTRDNSALLIRCLDSILRRTNYEWVEVILVDTGSREPETHEFYASLAEDARVSVVQYRGEFNFGQACNVGADHASGDLLLFLNNDTEALHEDWIERMVQWFEFADIGAVGAKLLFPDGRIQHAGVIVGMGGLASHVFLNDEEGQDTIFGSDEWYRNLSAVTAACLMVRRSIFEQVGGFDQGFLLNYSDVDLCLRIVQDGHRIVYTPDARLLHYESVSHGRRIPRRDFERAGKLWSERGLLDGDPYFNPNLSYMNPHPDYNRFDSDDPARLNARLMRRLPRKAILELPRDIS